MKQALQERDDWRALIDSVQKDRARLQEQCGALESALDAANAEVIALSNELEAVTAANASASTAPESVQSSPGLNRSASLSPSRAQRPNLSILCDEDEGALPSPMTSPVLDRNGQEISVNMSGPPNTVIRQLQAELKRAFAQVRSCIICNCFPNHVDCGEDVCVAPFSYGERSGPSLQSSSTDHPHILILSHRSPLSGSRPRRTGYPTRWKSRACSRSSATKPSLTRRMDIIFPPPKTREVCS
jgi:hypothetical protein